MEVDMGVLALVKKQLGIEENDTAFDADIIAAINTTLGILYQVGAVDSMMTLDDYITTYEMLFDDETIRELAKSYIYLKVRLLFDPPASSTIQKSFEETAKELEWRIYCINNKAEQ
jgi:hypothetical protein